MRNKLSPLIETHSTNAVRKMTPMARSTHRVRLEQQLPGDTRLQRCVTLCFEIHPGPQKNHKKNGENSKLSIN
jgi:hypothetical protein